MYHMSEQTANPSPDARRHRILELLDREGEAPVEMLAERFGVSGMTIRRDLQDLADEGRVLRTHGGAAPAQRISFEFRFLENARQHADAKREIANLAASLVEPGQTVILDSSTTTLAIAKRLKAIDRLTVVTTSLPIASELFGLDHVETVLLGGTLRKDSPDLFGAITDQNLEVLRGDVSFLGADAIDTEGGLYNTVPELGRMLSRMARSATRAYAVADHSKFDRHELMRFADAKDWTGLITDGGLDRSIASRLSQAGVNVLQPKTGKRGRATR